MRIVDNQRNASEGVEGRKEGQSSKRARTSEPKKRIKGRQGGLKGIMKMPIEIFMEIAPYVNPGDLIALIRTNKFFRAMLLTRSAAPIWQCALSNVPGLPPCPSGMNCGIPITTSKPDPYLGVRFCPPCRETELQEQQIIYSGNKVIVPHTSCIKRFGRWHSKNPVYQLRAHQKECERVRDEYTRNGDKKGLSEWEKQQQTAWNIRREEGDKLLSYINSTAVSRSDELRDLKTERRERIFERLRALGWDDKYFVFWRGSCSARKQWRALLEVSKPLTERSWTNMLPKLTLLLEENRPVIDEHEREGRRTDRRSRVATLLRKFNASTNPYQPIIDELQNSSASLASSERTNNKPRLDPPFPGDSVVGEWDFIISLCEEENSLDILDGLFNAHKDTISQKLLEWRTKVEDHLVNQYTSSFAKNTDSPLSTTLTASQSLLVSRYTAEFLRNSIPTIQVRGKSDATNHLSDNARFLLRADTIFMQSRPTPCYNDAGEEYGAAINNVHFPDMYQIQSVPYLYKTFLEPENIVEDLESYVRHEGKETIARALLKVLEMPDAAHIELKYMGKVFVCGRCTNGSVMEWSGIIEHYYTREKSWVNGSNIRNSFKTKHPVMCKNTHDLEPGAMSQPLVRIGDGETSFNPVLRCLICDWFERLGGSSGFESMKDMRQHMLEV
ncbi:hypothetical protein RHS04_08452 [Rhizoctonia solani]|uniref:F-box domain-containing protein n=1 Tax=Rhizoctonia solani TaxID=456999 RepID=A0A8H7GZW5_9AGAM|nr:hypothetical protein RHS04_08452 [Rhizoctonia solani]